MSNPTTITDIEDRWQPLTPQQTTNAYAWLDDAWWMLTSRRPTLQADLDAGTVTVGNVKRVVSAMVLRILRNPEGKKREAIDDYSYERHELVSSGLLHVTDEELADLTPPGTTAAATGAFTIRPYLLPPHPYRGAW